MNIEIFKSVILNIGLLIIIAQVLARIHLVKRFLVRQKHTLREQGIMIVIFGTISILSTYMGVDVHGAIANTRVIAVMAASFIGGPVVGIGTAIIGSLHRLLMDVNGFSALACSISTVVEGVIAAIAADYIKKNKYKESDLFLLTFLAEIIQMIIILIFAKPYTQAVALVRAIAVPMVLFNSIGMILFVGVFKYILIEQEYEIGKKVGLVFDITQKCLPLLRTGVYNEENCSRIGDIILDASKDMAILFTDKEKIISSNGKLSMLTKENRTLPEVVKNAIRDQTVCISEQTNQQDVLYNVYSKMVAIAAPLTRNSEIFGCLVVFTNKYKISLHSEIEFADGLSKLLSVQIELSQIEKQHQLLQKAEYHALQSQINPHFIFNSLNTISAFCREKPDKARELLVALATYFRNSIQTQDGFVSIYDEMDYVEAYLQLEKARFDDRLHITIEVPEGLECQMPCLLLQPIVENAVIHGAMKRKQGKVKISVTQEKNAVKISILDNGFGISQQIIEGLKNNTLGSTSIGLSNVEKRLCYIYGKEYGLNISSTLQGTSVYIYIPIRH